VARRDNLMTAIHMAVEAVFWFHPLVWWIGARMVEERERACDEEVLRLGKEPEVYAEGILKVCRFYVESPIECVSGVTGSDLKRRIEGIMAHRGAHALGFGRKVLLTSAGIAAVAGPLVFGAATASPIQAQSGERKRAFEVASVKPSAPDDHRSPGHSFLPGGRFTTRKVPAKALIRLAYDLPYILVSGGPHWLESENYDIDAKSDDPSVNSAQMKLMLQTLIADRFKVIVRRETKELPVYALVVAKNGPKLQKAEDRACEETLGMDAFLRHTLCHWILGGPGPGLSGSTVNMHDLALGLTARLGRPVIDKTGIEGNFDIKTSGWNPGVDISEGREPAPDPNAPTLFVVIEEQLGLKLESQKAPVETLFIEHAERPTQN
jgi:bla regulator protein BlaR1